MTQIVTRSGKGSALTYEEMDSNLTNLKTDVESTQANVIAANTRIATLDANLGTATTNITALQANAGTQSTEISGLRANITAANAEIATKTTSGYVDSAISVAINNLINSAPGTLDTLGEIAANLATNADTVGAILNSITSTNANVSAANARIVVIDANLGTATTNISTLFANAGTQTTEIDGLRANITAANARIQVLDANLGTATNNITTLFANAAAQSQDIAAVNAELDSVETWANINLNLYTNANVAAYLPGYGGNILVNTVTANAVAISTTAAQTPTVGKLVWDSGSGTLAYQYAGGNVVNYVGRQLNSLVYNGEATTLAKGEVVYIFGAQGQRPSVKRAQANSDTTSARTLGVVAESIASGAEGLVTIAGEVADINTSAFTEGAILYLSGTTPGAITQTKPQAPTHLVYVGAWSHHTDQTTGTHTPSLCGRVFEIKCPQW